MVSSLCDAYSTPTIGLMVLSEFQGLLVLPVLLCIPEQAFEKGWAVTTPGVLTIAEVFSGEAVLLLTHSYQQLLLLLCML
jgi:hypothetical protein